jgi:hypothetical protein
LSFNIRVETGEIWAYRERPRALEEPVHRVKIVKLRHGDGRVRVLRLDGDDPGLQDWVSQASLLSQWDDVEERLADERRLLAVRRASADAAGTTEYKAAQFVLAHSGLGRRVILGRSKADTGVLRVANTALVGDQLDLDFEQLKGEHSPAFINRDRVLIDP